MVWVSSILVWFLCAIFAWVSHIDFLKHFFHWSLVDVHYVLLSAVQHSESVIHHEDFFTGAFQLVKIIIIPFISITFCFFLWKLVTASRGRVLSRDTEEFPSSSSSSTAATCCPLIRTDPHRHSTVRPRWWHFRVPKANRWLERYFSKSPVLLYLGSSFVASASIMCKAIFCPGPSTDCFQSYLLTFITVHDQDSSAASGWLSVDCGSLVGGREGREREMTSVPGNSCTRWYPPRANLCLF